MSKKLTLLSVSLYYLLLLSASIACSVVDKEDSTASPNIIILYADDLGYGDIGAYGATRVKTPNIDLLAKSGIRFTDAHCAAATCTPSRYSLLTGNYAFRRNAEVLPGDAPLLIRPGTSTLPSMLQKARYETAVIGKWHLGLGNGDIDWNKKIKPGPLEIGFDYAFLLPSTGDRVPSVYLENYEVVNLEPSDLLRISFTDDPNQPNPYSRPTGITHPEILKQPADAQHSGSIVNGISRIGFMGGGLGAELVDEKMASVFLEKSRQFITKDRENPFFLYLSFHDIHVPRVPHPQFKGVSDMGPRGDAIAQMDWMVGQVLDIIHELKIEEETLIIFTSDNGPVLNDGYEDEAKEKLGNHLPAGKFRGGKYSAYEGGTRVPTIVYWPSKIAPAVSDALWSQVDLYATLRELLHIQPSAYDAQDSENMLEVLLGRSNTGRLIMLEESYTFSLRDELWKYIHPSDKDYSWVDSIKQVASGISSDPQLYNLQNDPEEKNNLTYKHTEKLQSMQELLKEIIGEK